MFMNWLPRIIILSNGMSVYSICPYRKTDLLQFLFKSTYNCLFDNSCRELNKIKKDYCKNRIKKQIYTSITLFIYNNNVCFHCQLYTLRLNLIYNSISCVTKIVVLWIFHTIFRQSQQLWRQIAYSIPF